MLQVRPTGFNSKRKYVFKKDYVSCGISLARLRSAALSHFAPPLQQLCAVLELRLPTLPDGPLSMIIGLVFGPVTPLHSQLSCAVYLP